MTHEEKIIAYQKLVDKRKNYTFKEFYCDWTPMKTGIGIVQKRNK
jgi:hypothetical protein